MRLRMVQRKAVLPPCPICTRVLRADSPESWAGVKFCATSMASQFFRAVPAAVSASISAGVGFLYSVMSSLRFEILKTKIVKGEGNRAGLHAKIAELPPIFCKDSESRENGTYSRFSEAHPPFKTMSKDSEGGRQANIPFFFFAWQGFTVPSASFDRRLSNFIRNRLLSFLQKDK